VPIARGALAAFECRLEKIVEHTTHIVPIGEVVETVLGDGNSLVYLDGGFSQVIKSLSAA
jgi:flavin reductase (DIM6/NTAB) family NADH-FMN oxidoreductase RutF